jgi:diacylglycerol kinase (ATP)
MRPKRDTGRGVVHLIKATRWSLQGLGGAIRGEEALRIELLLCLVLAPLGLWLGDGGVARALLLGSLLLVLIVELLNTAVETAIDRIGVEHHALSGHAKDVGSAAVLLAVVNVLCTWGLVLFG